MNLKKTTKRYNPEMQPFVHLHVHSQYSLLDGQANIARLVDKAMKDGMKAIALTDHGVMYGIKEFVNYVNKKNSPVQSKIKKIESEIQRIQTTSQTSEPSENIDSTEQQLKQKLAL
ncbi:MAG TPA: PHP domain-containing protein, partial [Dysgonamonadaceae bacterium]|nr:PHP domain-containing protein [Dysgonamonadaceae bacterium]